MTQRIASGYLLRLLKCLFQLNIRLYVLNVSLIVLFDLEKDELHKKTQETLQLEAGFEIISKLNSSNIVIDEK